MLSAGQHQVMAHAEDQNDVDLPSGWAVMHAAHEPVAAEDTKAAALATFRRRVYAAPLLQGRAPPGEEPLPPMLYSGQAMFTPVGPYWTIYATTAAELAFNYGGTYRIDTRWLSSRIYVGPDVDGCFCTVGGYALDLGQMSLAACQLDPVSEWPSGACNYTLTGPVGAIQALLRDTWEEK